MMDSGDITASAEQKYPNCDSEPLHISGLIQSRGGLLHVDRETKEILFCSENLAEFGFAGPAVVLGKKVGDCLPTRIVEKIEGLTDGETESISEIVEEEAIWFHLRSSPEMWIVEVEPFDEDDAKGLERRHRHYVKELLASESEEQLAKVCCSAIGKMLEVDRCIVLRFEPDQSGVVIAENNPTYEEDYLGLRFPSTDVPPNARALYRQNALRVIFDNQSTSIKVCGLPEAGQPDLTFSLFREVAPVHREYLSNMRVTSALSIPVLVRGDLWGMVSCHARDRRIWSASLRAEALQLMNYFGMKLRSLRAEESMRFLDANSRRLAHLATVVKKELFTDFSSQTLQALLDLTKAKGIAVLRQGEWTLHGTTPPREALPLYAELLADRKVGLIETDCCAAESAALAEWKDVGSGLLGIRLGGKIHDRGGEISILWFKPEIVQMVDWGGAPRHLTGEAMGPRKSFSKWRAEVREHSEPWGREARLGAQGLLTSLTRSSG